MYLEVCFQSVKSCGGPFRKSNVHACGCFVFQSVLHHSFSPLHSLGIMKTKKEKKHCVNFDTQRVLVRIHEKKRKEKKETNHVNFDAQ